MEQLAPMHTSVRTRTAAKIGGGWTMVAVMVHFMCQLDWAKGYPVAGKTLFLGMSVRVFLKRLAFESVD